MAKNQSTEVAVKAAGAVAMPDFMDAADFGGGFEGAGKDAYAIPFLQILQKMSPIVDEDSPKHIPGAKAGMILNTVTQKMHDVREKPLQIIPCAYKNTFILWGARDGDGGFKGEVSPDEMEKIIQSGAVENVDGRWLVKDANGNTDPKKSDYYADTRSHYVIAIDPETGEQSMAILSLSSSQIKASKTLMTMLQQRKVEVGGQKRTPPTFANVVELTTVAQSNDKGSWAGAAFKIVGLVTDPDLYAAAREFNIAVRDGAAKADYSKSADAGENVSSKPADAENF